MNEMLFSTQHEYAQQLINTTSYYKGKSLIAANPPSDLNYNCAHQRINGTISALITVRHRKQITRILNNFVR